jgi:hypothetical protein
MNSSITTERRRAEGAAEDVVDGGVRLGLGRGDDHALAGGEAIGLDHDRRARGVDMGMGRAASVKRAQAAVGAPQASQTSLVKVLELSSRAAAFRGPNTRKPASSTYPQPRSQVVLRGLQL